MRAMLLVLALLNLGLLGVLLFRPAPAAEPSGERGPLPRDDRPAVILSKLDQAATAEQKQATLLAELQRELVTARKDLGELRAAVGTLEEKNRLAGDDLKTELREAAGKAERVAVAVTALEKKLDKPPVPPMQPGQPPKPGQAADTKQLGELIVELRRLNDQFKRVLDFVGRPGGP